MEKRTHKVAKTTYIPETMKTKKRAVNSSLSFISSCTTEEYIPCWGMVIKLPATGTKPAHQSLGMESNWRPRYKSTHNGHLIFLLLKGDIYTGEKKDFQQMVVIKLVIRLHLEESKQPYFLPRTKLNSKWTKDSIWNLIE